MYGQIQNWVIAGANGKCFINIMIVASCALWLAAINRFDFFAGGNNLIIIIGRFITSSLGCIAVIGLFINIMGGNFQSSQLDRRTLVRSVSHPLPISESCTSSSSTSVGLASMEGIFAIAINYLLTLALTVMVIKMAQSNSILNYLLYAKRESTKS